MLEKEYMPKCTRCNSLLVQNKDTTVEIAFYDCPSCHWHFAQEPGKGLYDRWLSPLSIALYNQIFEKHPERTAEANAADILSQRPDLIPTLLNEIDRELCFPTQKVSEIHDFVHAGETSLRTHIGLLADALRKKTKA